MPIHAFVIMRFACDGALLIACPLVTLFSIFYPHTCLSPSLPLPPCISALIRTLFSHIEPSCGVFMIEDIAFTASMSHSGCPLWIVLLQLCSTTGVWTVSTEKEWYISPHQNAIGPAFRHGALLCSAVVTTAPDNVMWQFVLYVAYLGQSFSHGHCFHNTIIRHQKFLPFSMISIICPDWWSSVFFALNIVFVLYQNFLLKTACASLLPAKWVWSWSLTEYCGSVKAGWVKMSNDWTLELYQSFVRASR